MNNKPPTQAAIEDIEDFAPEPPTNELAPNLKNPGLRLLMISSYGLMGITGITGFDTYCIFDIPVLR